MDYRNIGSLGDSTGILIPVESNNNGQVYLATHDSDNKKLSLTQRSYISFSWGGKDIEDFNFLVISDGGVYQRNMYAPFEDITSENSLLDGKYYWGFHYRSNELVFSLATDGVLEKTLQEFRNWFRPGVERELILSEFPYRGIKARIAESPSYSLAPFEEQITCTINGKIYKTSTTKWRGNLSLHFIMDEPYWYSIVDVFQDIFTGENTVIVDNETMEVNEKTYENQLKAVIEDGIPYIDMFKISCLLPNNLEVKYENNVSMIQQQSGITLESNIPSYLYYCGTSQEKPKISFSFDLNQFDENEYFNGIGNIYTGEDYGEISIGNKKLKFTTPSILSAYNQAISIVSNDFSPGDALYELKSAFRDTLSNFYMRTWAMSICELALRENNELDICDIETGALTDNFKDNFIICLKSIFNFDEENGKAHCFFDFEKGECLFFINVNVLDLAALRDSDVVSINNLPIKTEIIEKEENGEVIEEEEQMTVLIEENSGDMLRSQYLTIEDRKLYNSDNEITENECLEIVSNYVLNDFKIEYRYRYL